MFGARWGRSLKAPLWFSAAELLSLDGLAVDAARAEQSSALSASTAMSVDPLALGEAAAHDPDRAALARHSSQDQQAGSASVSPQLKAGEAANSMAGNASLVPSAAVLQPSFSPFTYVLLVCGA